ncbi:conserved hypothetical protein [Leishmania mexicana MHOM/GT/2001/U1103]|uniref:Uncharacterized protein n=1 Tax=Leishmania mexicana (strain MHOM/GT/2001/U1103) TaxID=929439 RepID=E9B1V0_LEIMU|nr:conserved hypothetical protein [Leishmania mexicana MHOM/GT/2001/U1103]CBZ29207.1 conserved hypothetical protein [Leishmania mexicana MHOM/GT/2001/U1103]
MGVAPSRETIRRGFFNVNQANSSAAGSGSGGGGGSSKRQDIILIPLTKEYFPSPDCPLFVQFHKARCDAAVNYYFRRPGNPGDLRRIPNYASSYRLPGEETRAQRRRRRQQEREARATAAAAESATESGVDADPHAARLMPEGGHSSSEEDDDDDEDDSYPSREALYRGVIEHVEEMLFDTDAEMRQAYEWALAHPHTTMGPDGKKQRKVLPVLCAVAFRSDISKVLNLHNAVPGGAAARTATSVSSASPPSPSYSGSGTSTAMNNMQAALENGVYMFGSIINIVGCFGFASMQEDVEDAQRVTTQASAMANQATSLLTPGSRQSPSLTAGGTYHNDPYSFTSSQASSGGMKATSPMTSSGTLLRTRGTGMKGGSYLARIGTPENVMTLPPPVAAPLAAMVFLTKSAGEQNLGRVTYIAASTYYYQMIQAGVIERQPSARMEGPIAYQSPAAGSAPPLPPYGSGANSAAHVPAADAPPPMYGATAGFGSSASPATPRTLSAVAQGAPRPFLPPMETFSFSSLLTNIPILSFLYEMKWRWGYLGVLKGGTPTTGLSCNSSFSGTLSSQHMDSMTARGPGTMMGNHSTGGLSAVDRSVGQGVTDEMEMWITADQMIHGRISKDLAQRLCWSLAERPEVMQERVTQLPSEESGYWRYRGLVDQSHPPPVPEPGRVVTIHPKDVYVMGSDVLPGFNEGDILRFDPGCLVWFADHSIPLEGVVLAAMRPYCKQAREADSDDPAWVTRLCDRDELEALHSGDGDVCYPPPPASAEELGVLESCPNMVHIHEHIGNFYVYRFERDGTTYYHGTVPNFANPNKKKQAAPGGSLGASMSGSHNDANAPPSTATVATSPYASSMARPPPTLSASTTAASASKPASVPVPKTIASALFSLLPASRATAQKGSTGTSDASGSAVARGGVGERGGQASSQTGAGNTSAAPTAAYLATPVVSSASSEAMRTARRWVQAIYSYAYGVQNVQATRRGSSAANLAGAAAGPSRPPVLGGVPTPGAAGMSHSGGSYPSTPVRGSCGMTPTSIGASAGFPNVVAVDVAVWPPQRRMTAVTTPVLCPAASNNSFATPSTPTLTAGNGPAVTRHSRSSSRIQIPQTGAPVAKEVSPAAPSGGTTGTTGTSASKLVKRHVDGGSYEWDWR